MNKDEIIQMAKDAGCLGPGAGGNPNGLWEPSGHENVTELMLRFAALVAEKEREACAKVCDDIRHPWGLSAETADWSDATVDCADAIRARGNK